MSGQKILFQNLTESVLVIGMTLSTVSFNHTPAVNVNPILTRDAFRTYEERQYNQTINPMLNRDFKFSIHPKRVTKLDQTAKELFGEMREATVAETDSIKKYIQSISNDTGVNFFDIC